MKKVLCLLLFTSQILIAQHNVALLHVLPSFGNTNTVATDFAEVPFEMAGGMIVVQASVNGVTGNFILDTGAPGIVLAAGNGSFVANRKGGSVNGTMMVGEVEVKNFQLGIIHEEKTQGNVLDVHHLEMACGRDIMGLIGYEVLKNYEVVFDFPNRKIQAIKSGNAHLGAMGKPTATIPFVLCGHIPVIKAKVGGKRVYLGLDSGAEVNVLDKRLFRKIKESERYDASQEILTGLDGVSYKVLAANIKETKFCSTSSMPSMRYVFSDLSPAKKNFDLPIDGLLGIPFFKDKVVSIDYAEKKVFIWD